VQYIISILFLWEVFDSYLAFVRNMMSIYIQRALYKSMTAVYRSFAKALWVSHLYSWNFYAGNCS
jgi:hypothetical protein